MNAPREKTGWPIVAVLVLLLLLPLGLYVGCYFARSTTLGYGHAASMRAFRTPFETQIYQPAAKIEGLLRGYQVTLYCFNSVEVTE